MLDNRESWQKPEGLLAEGAVHLVPGGIAEGLLEVDRILRESPESIEPLLAQALKKGPSFISSQGREQIIQALSVRDKAALLWELLKFRPKLQVEILGVC